MSECLPAGLAALLEQLNHQPHVSECLPAGLAALLELDVETSYHAVQAIAQFAADERFRQVPRHFLDTS